MAQNQGSVVNSDEMLDFAEWLARYGLQLSDNSNIKQQRLGVVLLDQSMEVMMNVFLIGKGYKVFGLKNPDIDNGLKESQNPDNENTPGFSHLLDAVKRELPGMDRILTVDDDRDKDPISYFHDIRNKVYHGAAVTLTDDKVNEMKKYIPKLEQFYNIAFPNRSFEVNVRGKIST